MFTPDTYRFLSSLFPFIFGAFTGRGDLVPWGPGPGVPSFLHHGLSTILPLPYYHYLVSINDSNEPPATRLRSVYPVYLLH
ncbi:hypothetical protein BDW75DRAFT_16620 [Aspergillus navahoensis]